MKFFLSIIMFSTLLSSCTLDFAFLNSEPSEINDETIIESGYVNYRGIMVNDSDMMTTIPLRVDPSNTYEVTRSSYISYYNDFSFIETKLFTGGEFPKVVDIPEETTHIRVSFNTGNRDAIEFREVEE